MKLGSLTAKSNEHVREEYAAAVERLRDFTILHSKDRYRDRAHRRIDEQSADAREVLAHELERYVELPVDVRTPAGRDVVGRMADLYTVTLPDFVEARHAAVDRLTWSAQTEEEVVAERAKLEAVVAELQAELERRRETAERELKALA